MTFVPTFPVFPALSDAIKKTRSLTASNNSFQTTDAYIVQQMHSFYSYDLPAKFRSLKLKDVYTFTTSVGQDVYPFNSELYITVNNPCYCAKRELKLFTDPWNFYGVNYNWQQIDTNFAVGNGTTGAQTAIIIGASNASSAVFTVGSTANLVNGEKIILNNLLGGTWPSINGTSYNITIINSTTFSANGLNSTGLGTYTASTGSYYTSPYNGFTIASPLISSINNDPGALITRSPGVMGGSNLYFPQSRVQNVLISANAGYKNTQNVTDDGFGNLIQIFDTSAGNLPQQEYGFNYYRQYASSTPNQPGNATINYQTGEIVGLTFADPIPAGTPISIAYNPKVLSIPLSIMFFQNQLTVAPVPDAGYTIELSCYRQPIQALIAANLAGNPELSEWWEILAVGASKKIFENRIDDDGVRFIDKMLKERYDIIETRTYAQIGQQQIQTIYTDQLTQNYSQGGFGTGFGSI